jgi:hypothetical protein
MSRVVTPESAASLRPRVISRLVSLADSSRNKMRAAMRDLRQLVSYLGSPFFGMVNEYWKKGVQSNRNHRQTAEYQFSFSIINGR